MWDLFSRIANLVFLATAGLSILVAIFADQLVSLRLGVAPGFTAVQQALVADLMRINLLGTLLFSLSGLAIAGLQANQHFFLPALAPSDVRYRHPVRGPRAGPGEWPLHRPNHTAGFWAGHPWRCVRHRAGRGAVPAGAGARADLLPLPLATGNQPAPPWGALRCWRWSDRVY